MAMHQLELELQQVQDQSHQHQHKWSAGAAAAWEGHRGISLCAGELTVSLLLQERLCVALPFPSAPTPAVIALAECAGKKKSRLVCSLGAGLFRNSTS